MRVPHFLRLAQIDEQRFIMGCRNGIVHLTWGRITTRFTDEEFRRLVGLLERAADASPPTSLRDGNLWVTQQFENDWEVRMGALALLLSPAEFQELAQAAQQALERLAEILEAGVWDREEPEDRPFSLFEQSGRIPFSRN
ncbi:MAG: hypothetical protein PVH17_01330 [Anaerolineae bacterium]|jgi:hypothetical protein